MKKKTYLFTLMAMALTLGSCSDNENGIGGETSKYITVSTSIGNMTRVATDANGGQTFEEGDEISVYAWTGDATVAPETRERVVNNAINKLTNGSWISNPQMLWKNNRDKHYFIGVYPTAAISDLSAGEYTFDETKQVESDLLVAVNKDGLSYNVDEQQPVPLTFTHVMAKLVVNLTYKNQWGTEGPTVDKVAVGNAAKKATVNYLTKVVTPSAVAEDKADFLCYLDIIIGIGCTISIFDAEAERFKLVRTVSVRGTGIHTIYTRHDSNHIIHWIIALCQILIVGAAGKNCRCQSCHC